MHLIILIIVSFILATFFAASETAFSVVNRIKIKLWNKAGRSGADVIEKHLEDPDTFLVPTLVGTNISHIVFASSCAHFLIYFNIKGISHFELTIYETIALVFFGEVIPKLVVKNSPEKSIFSIVFPFIVLKWMLLPANIFINTSSKLIVRILGIHDASEPLLVTKDDIGNIIDEAVEVSGFNKEHAEFINRVMELKTTKVKEIMTHRSSIVALEADETLYKLKKLVKHSTYSKIIVYEENLDNITGAVYANEIFYEGRAGEFSLSDPISSYVNSVKYFPDNTSVYSLFKTFKSEKVSLAVILDEFGGSIGIVTMHDVLEFIVGRVTDFHRREKDRRGITYREDNHSLIVEGSAEIELINKMLGDLGISENRLIDDEKYETINGFIINYLQKIPCEEETFTLNGLEFEIVRSYKNRIKTIVIYLPEQNSE